MPEDAALAKVDATRGYGADVRLIGAVLDDALEARWPTPRRRGAVFVHPFDDPLVIAGQGTLGLELAEQLEEATTVVVPVRRRRARARDRDRARRSAAGLRVVGVQAARCAPLAGATVGRVHDRGRDRGEAAGRADASDPGRERSTRSSRSPTSRSHTRSCSCSSARSSWSRARARRPSPRSSPARVDGTGPSLRSSRAGTSTPPLLIEVARHGLTHAGRYLVVRTRVPDRPGAARGAPHPARGEQASNVVEVQHQREGVDIAVWETEIELTLLTRDEEHCREATRAGLAELGLRGRARSACRGRGASSQIAPSGFRSTAAPRRSSDRRWRARFSMWRPRSSGRRRRTSR